MAEAHKNVSRGDSSWSPQGRGRRRAISRSKRRKRMATRKNRREKGNRAVPRGSKPHSYGESFSWSGFIWGSQKETMIKIVEIKAIMMTTIKTRLIIFPWILTKTG